MRRLKKRCKVRCSRRANSTQRQHLLNSFLECNPLLLWQQRRLANGHMDTRTSVTKSLLCRETHWTQRRAWTLRANGERRRKRLSPLKWHTCVQQRIRKVRKRCWRRENCWLFLIFFPRAHHTATGLTQWTILFLFPYLFKLYLCECFWTCDASYNTRTPPSLIQLYCSFLCWQRVVLLGFIYRKKDLFGNMQDMLGRRRKPECTVKYFFLYLNVGQFEKKKKKITKRKS